MNLFVISDIHGMSKQFEQLLTYWDPKDKLVLLGDLVDRGPHSLEVIQKVMALKAMYENQVILCMGNHDKMLLDFIASPLTQRTFYFPHGGRQTMQSFINGAPPEVKALNAIEQADYVQTHFSQELDFLKRGKLYEIVGNVLFTHAGFESTSHDFLDSTEDDFLWIRDHYLIANKTPYISVFGHTPTRHIHEGDDIWVSADGKYIGIDGGCVFGGQLNALLITQNGKILHQYSVDNGAAKRKEQLEPYKFHVANRTFEGILLNVQQKLALSHAEMANRLEISERHWLLLVDGKGYADREKYQKVYDLFIDYLSPEQKAYLLDYLKEPETQLSQEDILKLLKGKRVDF